MILDVKIEGHFTRMVIMVDRGHTADPNSYITFTSVVNLESSIISFLLAVLKNLNISASYIGNSYSSAYCKEKNCKISGS